jgi:hypothetical protein
MDSGSRLLDDEIRILHLLPSSDVESAIQCDLMREKTGDKAVASYCALSYVWDNPQPAQPILLNGSTAYVTPNLNAALRQFRDPVNTVRLWVDALCINQNDVVERSAVVKRMGNIYNSAAEVWMWLGEEESDSNLAMELIQRVGSFMEAPPNSETGHSCWSLVSDPTFEPHCEALRLLFDRPYWKRVWIVQEVLLVRWPIICCGTLRAAWIPFVKVFTVLQSCRSAMSETAESIFLRMVRWPSYSAEEPFGRFHEGQGLLQPTLPLLEGLFLSRSLKATDPKDHIYGILGLVDHKGLEPDYAKSNWSLYTNVVKHLIEKDHNLDVLSACIPLTPPVVHMPLLTLTSSNKYIPHLQWFIFRINWSIAQLIRKVFTQIPVVMSIIHHYIRIEVFPSWVPLWEQGSELPFMLLHEPLKCHYRAAGSTLPVVHFPVDKWKMQVHGIQVDEINNVSDDINNTPFKVHWEQWKVWRRDNHSSAIYRDVEDEKEAFIRTLTGGRGLNGEKWKYDPPAYWLDFVFGVSPDHIGRGNTKDDLCLFLRKIPGSANLGLCRTTNQGLYGPCSSIYPEGRLDSYIFGL